MTACPLLLKKPKYASRNSSAPMIHIKKQEILWQTEIGIAQAIPKAMKIESCFNSGKLYFETRLRKQEFAQSFPGCTVH
jgi:hypothetical protein